MSAQSHLDKAKLKNKDLVGDLCDPDCRTRPHLSVIFCDLTFVDVSPSAPSRLLTSLLRQEVGPTCWIPVGSRVSSCLTSSHTSSFTSVEPVQSGVLEAVWTLGLGRAAITTDVSRKQKAKCDEATVLTVLLPLARPGPDAGFGCDRHHRLSDRLLPALAHVPAHAGRRQGRVVVQTAVILPDVVHHVGGDHLEAVRVAGLGQAAEVLCRLHLQDLGQRDLLRGQMKSSALGKLLPSMSFGVLEAF